MAAAKISKISIPKAREAFDCVALVLQGGGALGAYQCGAYEALAEADVLPTWVAGISIGAINGAIIAGNPPETRVERLWEFWDTITRSPVNPWIDGLGPWLLRGEWARQIFGQSSALGALVGGAEGFFKPRVPSPWFQPTGSVAATSFYDTDQLRTTLERLIDFDRINSGEVRLSVGTVNVQSGNFVYFDTEKDRIGPEHIMASGALPPGFPAVEIDGQRYWDGGLVSNTPLQWIVEQDKCEDTLMFQIDLWNARGQFPQTMADVLTRQKEITFSSRTREQTDRFKEHQRLCRILADFLDRLPPDLKKGPEAEFLEAAANRATYNIVHLIYRAQNYEGQSKDYEFSRLSMSDHWKAGYDDAVRTLRHPAIFERAKDCAGIATFDLSREPG
ncbi:MAG: patatin-like phospholipase family protein [Rhodospirillaceae bacterium]|nr:MAG: patatin-like phospholipase family protein [Rhodospirillaceae bacterium]